jgi:hypothetical protein
VLLPPARFSEALEAAAAADVLGPMPSGASTRLGRVRSDSILPSDPGL